jgi:hypothetical protein
LGECRDARQFDQRGAGGQRQGRKANGQSNHRNLRIMALDTGPSTAVWFDAGSSANERIVIL